MGSASDPRYWIGFQLIPGIGPVAVATLLQHFGSLDAAWEAGEAELAEAGITANAARSIAEQRRAIDLQAELDKLERHGVRAVPLDDPDYPRLLREIPTPPILLYILGTLEPVDDLAIGIVGTRRATGYGTDMTRRISTDLASAGVTIVSGLALGVDTVAHRAALDAGGRTIAVCGCGLDTIYPPRNRNLAGRVVESGAMVSEFPIGTKPDARNFPARNRIISGLARGTVVVEAPRRSGALITARFAADQGRDVYAVPGSALSQASEGCHTLIRDGATLITSAADVLEELNVTSAQSAVQTRMALPESEEERRLLALIGAEPRHVDELCQESGLPIQETNGLLLALELKGLIRQQGFQHYVRT